MADNVTADPGSGGATFAGASLSFSGDTAVFPIGSGAILTGSEGSWTSTLIVGGAGAVTAGVQRMTLASDDPAVTSLAVLDDWDESDRAKVNLIVGQAGIAAGAGAVGATVPRVTLASDDPGVAVLGGVSDAAATQGSTGSISAKLRTVTSQLNTIDGKITAVNTGAVVVSSSALPSGAATAAKQPALGTAGTPSSDVISIQGVASGTVVPVSDGSGSLTVDGTVAATQSGTWTVGLSAAQTLATVTTVSTLTGGGVAHDAVDSGNPVKIGGRAVSSLASATLVAAADRSDLVTDLDGALIVRLNRPMGDAISERVTDTGGTSTAFSNFGAVASTRNVISAIAVYNSSATSGFVDFRDGTGGAVLWTMPVPAGGGSVLSHSNALFRTSANTALAYDVSGALSTVYISVSGFQSKG